MIVVDFAMMMMMMVWMKTEDLIEHLTVDFDAVLIENAALGLR